MRNRIKFESNKEDISVIRQYSKIRYDKKLNKEIDDTLRRYNNKIDRLAKERSNVMLPQKVSKDDLMEISWTRRDIERRLNNLRDFTKRGAETTVLTKSGYAISQYELKYLNKEKARLKRKMAKELKYYETTKPKLFGKDTSRTFAQMGEGLYLNLQARYNLVDVDISNLAIDELFEYRKMLYTIGKDKDYLAENFKENFLDMLTDVGYHVGYNEDKIEKLKEVLRKIEPSKFYDLYINEKAIRDIANYYYVTVDGKKDPRNFKQNVSDLYDSIIDNLDDVLENYVDMNKKDLKSYIESVFNPKG